MIERVILVTGSRKGIGRALVEHFVALGHRVHGCSRSKPRWQLEGYVHHLADVTDERQVKTMLRAIKKGEGRLEVLVNNAGMASMNHVLLSPTGGAYHSNR